MQTTFPSNQEQSIPTGRFKPLVSFKNHKLLAFFTFLLVIGIALPVSYQQGQPVFNTLSVVLVSPRFVPNLDVEKGMDYLNRTDYQLYIQQQTRTATRVDVLKAALQRPEVRRFWLRPTETEDMALTRLALSIKAENKRGSPFITISLKSSEGKGLDTILNTIVEIYLKQSQEENLYDRDVRIDILQQRRDELLDMINQRRKLRSGIAEELGVTTFKEDSLNPYDDLLIESTKAYNLARRARVEIETRFNTLKESIPGQQAFNAQIQELVANDSTLNRLKSTLGDRRSELISQMSGLTPQHITRQRIEKEILQLDQELQQATQRLFAEIQQRLLEQRQGEVFQAQQIEQALFNEMSDQRKKANHYAGRYNQALVLNKEIERAYQQLDKIDQRVDFLTIEASAPGFVRLDSPALIPIITGSRKKIFLIFSLLGLGLAFLLPTLVDLLDKRLQTPGEVHKILGFPALAWILNRRDQPTRQLAFDHLRRLALTLIRDYRHNKTRHFVLTSVKSGGGSTTLTLEIAQILISLGVRTLAVELNAFKPDARYQNDSPLGLVTLLDPRTANSLSLDTVIVPATDLLPPRLPLGTCAERHLSTHGRLTDLLSTLDKRYDLILLDAPPLLLSADAELLGEIAGGVLLIIEAGHITPGELKRAAHLLERLNPPVVGTILNRVKVYKGGGYFAELLKEHTTGNKPRKGWLSRLFWN